MKKNVYTYNIIYLHMDTKNGLDNKEEIDIMKIIEKDDLELLNNKRIYEMGRMDWGKTVAISNQYIHRNILRNNLEKYDYKIYCTDDIDLPKEINISNNSPGFDIIVITPDKKIFAYNQN